MNFQLLLWVFLGGGLGTILRFGVGKLFSTLLSVKFPLGTLVSNALACLILGLTLFILKDKMQTSEFLRHFVIIGICGGFSTFSAFSFETVKLLQDGLIGIAFLNILISLSIGFGIIYLLVK